VEMELLIVAIYRLHCSEWLGVSVG